MREPFRSEVCKVLKFKSVERYRAEEAAKGMLPNGKEPPTLPKASVLNTAKSHNKAPNYVDRCPIISLFKMKYTIHSNCIQAIGYEPFHVSYTTNNQEYVQ